MEKLFAYLSYADAPRALEWLSAVGFAVVARVDSGDGRVEHAEVRLGDATVMVFSRDQPYENRALLDASTGGGLYLQVADVDGIFAKAVAAGGRPVIKPEDTEWGGRRGRVLDLEGNEWTFGTYEPGARDEAVGRALQMVPLVHVDEVEVAAAFFETLGAQVVAQATDGDFARLRFTSGDEIQLLGHPPNPEQDTGLVELTAVVGDLDPIQTALDTGHAPSVTAQNTGFGRQAIYRIPGGPPLKINEFPAHTTPAASRAFFVVELTLAFPDLDTVKATEPELLAAHLDNSARQHAAGELLMAGLFLDATGTLESMSVLASEDAAHRFLESDPFLRAGYATSSRVRPWANMFATD